MKDYLVKIGVNIPYPKEFSYTEGGSNAAVAVSRAFRKFRKEIPKKRIKELSIKVIQL